MRSEEPVPHPLALEQPRSRLLQQAPAWRREPYRLLFPLAILLSWAGVLHWLLLGLGVIGEYRSVFHSMAQIQGVMTCFAAGFLFTMIPRRTGTSAPAVWEMAVVVLGPMGTTAFAWYEQLTISQVLWIATIVVMLSFAVRRLRSSEAKLSSVPPSFVWIPVSLVGGALGSVLTAVGGATGNMQLHDVGRGMLLQGMMAGLVVGVGGFLLPMLFYAAPADRPLPLPRATLPLAFFGSFILGPFGHESVAFVARALIVGAAFILPGRLWRAPTVKGLTRRLSWFAGWCLPLGFALVAAFPEYRRAGLHVVFIGAFGLMAFAISAHVALSHGSGPGLFERSTWALRAMGLLMFVAVIARGMVDVDPVRFSTWLIAAAAAFLLATVAWGAAVIRAYGRPAGSKRS